MQSRNLGLHLVAAAGSLALLSSTAYGMPMFARKYGADCSMCHTQVPKLNRIGYEFRSAGYRLPGEIGKNEKPFKLGDFFAARLQAKYVDRSRDFADNRKEKDDRQLEFHEFTMYPLTGSWGKYFASLGEFSMSPDDVFEIENAYVRGVYGNEDGWFQARVGIMHAFEGWGASDRPIGINRPLFQGGTAIGSPFKIWSLDEMAAEVGYHYAKTGTSISARISNGYLWKEDGSGKGEPAQGGGLTKPSNVPGHNDKSYQIFINQIIRNDSGLSFYWYRGTNPFPDPNAEPPQGPPFTKDTINRYTVYGNFYVLPTTLNLLGGYSWGKDSLDNRNVAGGDKVGDSNGWFVEADYFVKPSKLALGARYDKFDPSDKVSHNDQKAWSVFANYYISHGLQLLAEYRHKTTEAGEISGDNTDNEFQLRGIFIW